MDWQDVRVFSALARSGTLSAAARALGVNHVTVGRRIARLEAALGVRLFERRPDGYQLTERAGPLLEAVQRMEDAAESLARQDPQPTLSGLVRLTATGSLIDICLLGWFAPFLAEHPHVDLDLIADRRSLSLARHEADIALRLARPEDGGVVARQLVDTAYGVYAASAWAARLEAGEAPEFVTFDEVNAAVPEAVWVARTFPEARVRLRTGAYFSQARACAAGIGVAVLPAYVARRYPALRTVDIGAQPPPRTLWLLTRQDVRAIPRIRAVADFLTTAFAANQAMFATDAASPTFRSA